MAPYSEPTVASSSELKVKAPSKRLVFDRRYGWVYDEWKDPSEEALSGGRGMFCIVPLTKSFLCTASQSVNSIANSVIQVMKRPELLLHHQLFNGSGFQGQFDDQEASGNSDETSIRSTSSNV